MWIAYVQHWGVENGRSLIPLSITGHYSIQGPSSRKKIEDLLYSVLTTGQANSFNRDRWEEDGEYVILHVHYWERKRHKGTGRPKKKEETVILRAHYWNSERFTETVEP